MDIKSGTPVRFTTGNLGTLRSPDSFRFTPKTVHEGMTGHYHGRHALSDWHFCTIVIDGETLYVPVSEHHFEVMETET